MRELLKMKRLWLLLCFPIGILILLIVKISPYIAEHWFSRGIYHVGSQILCFITGLVPISVAELLVYSIPFAVIFVVYRIVRQLIRDKKKRCYHLARYGINLLCGASVLYLLFMIFCGANYYRYPFSKQCNLTVEKYSVEELFGLCTELANKANELRSQIKTVDNQGAFKLSQSDYKTAKEAKKAMESLAKKYPSLSGYYAVPKPVLASRAMTYIETTGLFSTFTMEANVNVECADYDIPATMCHELSHQMGYMKEDEANYIAYLACMNSDNIEFQYSGTMDALSYATNELYDSDINLYKQIKKMYSKEVLIDKIEDAKYWNKYYNKTIAKVSSKINDTYLKANNQESGEQSYGEMVDLLLAEYRARHK